MNEPRCLSDPSGDKLQVFYLPTQSSRRRKTSVFVCFFFLKPIWLSSTMLLELHTLSTFTIKKITTFVIFLSWYWDWNTTTFENSERLRLRNLVPFQAWIQEMAFHVKSIDPKHLLGTGLEGFYGPSTPDRLQFNPNTFAGQVGTDFIRNHQVLGVDFASAHIYPDSW